MVPGFAKSPRAADRLWSRAPRASAGSNCVPTPGFCPSRIPWPRDRLGRPRDGPHLPRSAEPPAAAVENRPSPDVRRHGRPGGGDDPRRRHRDSWPSAGQRRPPTDLRSWRIDAVRALDAPRRPAHPGHASVVYPGLGEEFVLWRTTIEGLGPAPPLAASRSCPGDPAGLSPWRSSNANRSRRTDPGAPRGRAVSSEAVSPHECHDAPTQPPTSTRSDGPTKDHVRSTPSECTCRCRMFLASDAPGAPR